MKKITTLFMIFLVFSIFSTTAIASDSDYNPIIKKYIQAIDEHWDAGKLSENNMYSDMGFNYGNSTTLENYGYAFIDLNSDGDNELLIGQIGNRNYYNQSYIFDAYTLVNSIPVSFIEAWDRNTYQLTSTNLLKNHGSGGASLYGETISIFNGKDLSCLYQIVYCDGNYYFSDKDIDFKEEYFTKISKAEFDLYNIQDYQNIDYTPFSEFSETTTDTFQPSLPNYNGPEYSTSNNNYVFKYNGEEFPLVAYNDFEDNSKWTNVYEPFTIESGKFDWVNAIVSAISANDPDVEINPSKDKRFFNDPNNSNVISGIDLGTKVVSLVHGFVTGGRAGIDFIRVFLQTNGSENRMLLMYGTPIEETYCGKTLWLSDLLSNAHGSTPYYMLFEASKDQDKAIRSCFKNLEPEGKYSMKITYSKHKDIKDSPYGYSIVIGDDGNVYHYPIIHNGTKFEVYHKTDKKANFAFDATQLIGSEKIHIRNEIGKDIIDYLENKAQLKEYKTGILASVSRFFFGCPVDVEIYNEDNNLIYTIKDQTTSFEENENGRFICSYNPYTNDYEKYVYVPEGKTYTFKLKGTDNGSVDIIKSDFSNSETLEELTIPVTLNSIIELNTNSSDIKLDSDGNGIFEDNFNLSKKEFDSQDPDTSDEEDANEDKDTSLSEPTELQSIYRLYNRKSGEHLYTTDSNEVNVLRRGDWNYEGISWKCSTEGSPVYRLYSPVTGYHLYTTDLNEVNVLSKERGWSVDNKNLPLYYSNGSIPIYRLYNSILRQHLLTTDQNEYAALPKYGWTQEGVKLNAISR